VVVKIFIGAWSVGEMNENARTKNLATRYLLASLLCLVIAIRFYTIGDVVGTTLYSAATPITLFAAFLQYTKRK
jgi:hypothetical protein